MKTELTEGKIQKALFKDEIEKVNNRINTELLEILSKELNSHFEQQIKGLKEKIWEYMREHPTKDRGVVISPSTHHLIIEETDCYTDDDGAEWIYAKRFHFEMRECVMYENAEQKIEEYDGQFRKIQ